MAQAKQASKRRRGKKALPVLGVAGMSVALAGGASAATAPAADVPQQGITPNHQITLGEEEIADVSLSTFYVFDKETAQKTQAGEKLAWWGRCGCGRCGCGRCGCGYRCWWRCGC